MSQNRTLNRVLHIFSVMVSAFFVALTYNNCGQQIYQPTPYRASNEKMMEDFAKLYAGVLSVDLCADADKYECAHKIFSQDVEYSQSNVDFPCLKVDGNDFCVAGLQFTYNSKSAADNCQEGCSETYEYEEFNCYLKLPDVSGYHPIQAEGNSLQSALDGTHARCKGLVK